MSHFDLALLGFGNVGRALARLLLRKENELKEEYDLTFAGRHGTLIDQNGIDLQGAIRNVEAGLSLPGASPTLTSLEFIHHCGADVLFENTPVNHQTGQPAIDHLKAALEGGMHVITANKGPVVHAYQELTELAARVRRKFYFEAVVMDGAPIFSLFRAALPAARLQSFNGLLNSTTNLILERMEAGESFEEAVKYTQAVGLAETDPSADIDGWDAAIKVAALVTVLMGVPFKPQEVERTGIRAITPGMIAEAKAVGKRWKLVCSAGWEGKKIRGRVVPQLVTPDSQLYTTNGSSSIIEFHTDTLTSLSVVEGNPTPETTAYGLLADFLNAVRS